MESISIRKICFVLLLIENCVVSIYVENEKLETKPEPKTEDLKWMANFSPVVTRDTGRSSDGKRARLTNEISSLCPSGITGQFPYPPDCKRFVNCWKGRGMIQVCGPGTLFNPATGECDFPDKVKCIESNDFGPGPKPLTSRFPAERPGIADNPRISRKNKENYQAESTVHRPVRPVRPPYYGQSYLTRPTARPTPQTGALKEQKLECPPGAAGLYPHPNDCTQFLNCWGRRMFVQRCGPGTYFNPDMGVCDHMRGKNCDENSYGDPYETHTDDSLTEQVEDYKGERGEESTDYVVTAPPDVEQPDVDDPRVSGANLLDVRGGEEEDVGEDIQKPEEATPAQLETDNNGANKERDPSWGKILNWNTKQNPQPEANRLFYDAHGNPVNSNSFWTEAGRPIKHVPSQQPKQQPPTQWNGQNPVSGDSTVYYIRPHNHVMNQYPPHLQNNWARYPIYNNPQSYPQVVATQTVRPPAVNPYYPSTQYDTVVPGHFILAENPPQPKLTHDSHQKQDALPQYLVPPRQEAQLTHFQPEAVPEAPSRVLLPPREDIKPEAYPKAGPDNFDYSGWIALYNARVPPPPQNATVGQQNPNFKPHLNPNPNSSPNSNPTQNWYSFGERYPPYEPPSQKAVRTQERKTTPPPTTTTTTTTRYNWSAYYGDRNPYGLPNRTVHVTPTTAPTTTTTNRVYVVYPVKNHESDNTGYTGYKPESLATEASSKTPVRSYTTHRPQYTATDSVKGRPTSERLKTSQHKKPTEEDLKKRIKSEVDFGGSDEDGVTDVEMLPPDFIPNAGKNIRLKPLSNHLDGYIEMKGPNGQWGLVCDKDYGWMINEATVVCKELGYGRGAQISWQGYPLDQSTESIPVAVTEVICNGNEESLTDCHVIYGDNGCDITKNAVGLRCFDNVTTQCHPEEVEYNNNCYRLVKRDDLDDRGLSLEEAADYCKKIGGRITDVISEEENNFISDWLLDKYPDVRSVLTGGIGSAFMGRSLWMWFGSQVPMIYQKWWKGWADENKIKQGTVHEPSCVVLRKSYPCFVRNDDGAEVELGNLEPEYCPANYFYWDVEECKKLRDLNLPHICKKPLEEIGCVVGRGENYTGTASVTSSGLPCLPWDHPEVKSKLAHQITLQEWSTKLSGHNFCRNLGRQELHPWCFVEGKENSEYCSIPQCWDSVPGYSKSATPTSTCDETQFECKAGECIPRKNFCDGRKDCSNGRDEAMCRIFLQEFKTSAGKRMKGHGKEIWPDVSENTCAKLCLENKKFKCKSFTYQRKKKACHLSDTNVGLSGNVISAGDAWTYHELSVSSLNCTISNGFMGCRNGKCVNVSNVCDGKDNCGDGSDEVDCGRLGYEIRLAGSNETNKGRVEVKVLGVWGAVCDDKFNLQAGEVVCRELGFKHGVAEVLPNSHFPPEPNTIFLIDDLECLGNETSIRECSFPGWYRHDCKSEEAVGVVCRIPETTCPDDHWHCRRSKECIPIRFLCDGVKDCDDESDENQKICNEPVKMRLSGGPNATSGRLEIRYLDTWGTICDDDFNDAAATVICRTLGYHGPAYAFKNARFGPGTGPIWLDGVQCFGNETNVDECDHSPWGKHNCKHDEDVSISCSHLMVSQKSAVERPVAASTDVGSEMSSTAKLRQVLLRECAEDSNATVESVRVRSEIRPRVVGSDVVTDGIPWQASIRVRSPGGKSSHWCGAVVISPYHVLTAGHCLRDYSKPAYFVRVGDFDTETEDPEEQEFGIDHLYTHPEFNRKLHLNNDIALIKVKGEIHLGKRVRPACLVPSPDMYLPGTNCSISGWGSISPHSTGYARTLRRAYVPILEPSLCRAPFVYGKSLSEGMFCAGKLDGGVDSCQGDSGGPMMCQFEGREYLFGITSWGHGCGRANKPGVYTNVARYSEWIQEKIEISLA